MEAARVDQWLWAVRVYKTRTAAADACRGGHVKVNGASAKPATPVKPGDRVVAKLHGHERILEVVNPIAKRVGAAVAADCFIDHSPPPLPREEHITPLFERPPAAGRPTKRERRQLDRFRSR